MAADDYLALQARLQPERTAALDLASGRSWSYRTFERSASQYAGALRARGIGRGDRVAVLATNRVELVLMHLACARIGAIYVPLNWRLSPAELARLVEDAEPRVLFGDAALARAQLIGSSLDEFAELARNADEVSATAPDRDAPSLILYTSGTSGQPKGVLLSEGNIGQTALNFSILGRVTHSSAVLCDSPMFHIIGLITNIRPALMRGGRIVVSDGFVPARTLQRLGDPQLGITHYFCVPQMAALLRQDPSFDPGRLRGLTAIFSGGGPHSAAAVRAWTDVGIPMADGYGMSEAGTVSCMPLDLDSIAAHAGSAGVVPPGFEMRIEHAGGEACAVGEPGEIAVRGPGVSAGYWRRPADSNSALTKDGWLRTGDIGRLDAEGFLWLLDRKKDMFISGGENVYPAEIEGALVAYPCLVECAVIGVPDERWGEVGHLVIVAAADTAIDSAAVLAYLASRLARYKVPKHISTMTELPRNGAGKILKGTLRAAIIPGAATPV